MRWVIRGMRGLSFLRGPSAQTTLGQCVAQQARTRGHYGARLRGALAGRGAAAPGFVVRGLQLLLQLLYLLLKLLAHALVGVAQGKQLVMRLVVRSAQGLELGFVRGGAILELTAQLLGLLTGAVDFL